MLKIKSNTNEFTIIFLRRLKRKRMLKRSRSASVQFRTPSTFLLLFFLFQHLFSLFFLLLFSAASFSFSVSVLAPHFCFSPPFLFFWSVALYFSALNTFSAQTFFSPKTLFLAQNVFASAQNVFQFSPKHYFSVQCHSSLLVFSGLFFSGLALFFLFQRLLFFFSLAPFIQDPIFSLAASHLFYLNKSLFSSNLE